jgi:hypothetical protein
MLRCFKKGEKKEKEKEKEKKKQSSIFHSRKQMTVVSGPLAVSMIEMLVQCLKHNYKKKQHTDMLT